MSELKNLKCSSFEEFENMDRKDGWRYELLDGAVMMAPPPSGYHQEIISNISEKLFTVLDLKTCRPFSETACRTEDSYLIPDLSIRCVGHSIPVVVFEVLSPSTRLSDLLYKPLEYKKMGVKEYWIVDPVAKTIAVYDFANDTAEVHLEGQTIQSAAFPELILSVSDVLHKVYFQ